MKLKLLKAPRPGQKDMVVHTEFGTYSVKAGETLEVSDEAGHAIMAKWNTCFLMLAAEPKKTPSKETKMKSSYENKKL